MKVRLFVYLLLFAVSTFSSDLCTTLKQEFIDSKRFFKSNCKIDSDCEIADLKWDNCSKGLSLNKKFIKDESKHFFDLRDQAYGACNIRAKTCERVQQTPICYAEFCTTLDELYKSTGDFKIYLKFEGKTNPFNEIILRREQIVYCITTPCDPITTDVKIKLIEGILVVTNDLIPYQTPDSQIRFSLVQKGYEARYVSRKELISLKDKTIEFKLSKVR